MIPAAYITEWRSHAPWTQNAWVEQDLIISRAPVDIFDGLGARLHEIDVFRVASRAQFEANRHEKRTAPLFRSDIDPLLRPGLGWDLDVAMDAVLEKLVAHLPGEPWKGLSESRREDPDPVRRGGVPSGLFPHMVRAPYPCPICPIHP